MEARFKLLLFALFVSFNYVASQEMKSDKGDWIFTSQIGFASLEAEGLFKTTATIVENTVGKEIIIGERASIAISIEHLDLRTDSVDDDGDQFYLKNNHFTIPIVYQIETNGEQIVSVLAGLGVYGSYLYKSETENSVNQIIRRQHGLGWNFGLQMYFDTQLNLNDNIGVIIGIKTKTDAFTAYKNDLQNFKLTDLYALRFGLKWHPKG